MRCQVDARAIMLIMSARQRASSSLLKHHDRLRPPSTVSAIGAQIAVSTASCAVACAALDVRTLAAG